VKCCPIPLVGTLVIELAAVAIHNCLMALII
jgi:hypothetical protein